jgi:adenylosuccinate lyase
MTSIYKAPAFETTQRLNGQEDFSEVIRETVHRVWEQRETLIERMAEAEMKSILRREIRTQLLDLLHGD